VWCRGGGRAKTAGDGAVTTGVGRWRFLCAMPITSSCLLSVLIHVHLVFNKPCVWRGGVGVEVKGLIASGVNK
jgi:hypothetical protein